MKVRFLILTLFALAACNATGPISELRCEYQTEPINIDNLNPRFTWNYNVPEDFIQIAYTLTLAADPDFQDVVWTSGEQTGERTLVKYEGGELASHKDYYWKVDYALDNGKSYTSDVQKFTTAMMPSYKWVGKWISDGKDMDFAPSPMLRKSFEVDGKVADAKLYISAAAYYRVSINGEDPTGVELDPGYTHYDKRNLYSVYDVTSCLHQGENAISAVVGSGFYNEAAPVATWDFENARWRDRAKMIAELHIEYQDGTREVIATDGTWKCAVGPYISDNIYSGDVYDARKEIPGWNKPSFDDSSWNNAVEVNAPSMNLRAQQCPPIKAGEILKPAGMQSWGDTVYVFDFGKNITGLCTINLKGPEGTKVTLTHSELLKKDGNIEMGNINIYYKPIEGYELQQDVYYMKGAPEGERFTPLFSYHGFQYVEVRCSEPLKLTADDIEAKFFHTALERTGDFECSNGLFNRIYDATHLSYLGNLQSIPTDCPQREKNGWTADAYLALEFALMNYDGLKLYEKWVDDMTDSQMADGNLPGIVPTAGWGYDDWIGPVWAASFFIVPNTLYDYYGDTEAIEKLFPVCRKYLAYLNAREDKNGTVTYGIGDWVWHKTPTPTDYSTTAFYYYENVLAAKFAGLLGEDGSKYSEKAAQLKDFINRKYFDREKCVYANGSQAAQGIALYLGLVPEEYISSVSANLSKMILENDGFLDFGSIGSKTVPRTLADNGYVETVYGMADKKESPSWGGWLSLGLSTLAETWVLDMVNYKDASVNHVFLGDISAWMANYLTGIKPVLSENGTPEVVVEPCFPENLDWAKASYKSVKGDYKVEWSRIDDFIKFDVQTPANSTTQIKLDKLYTVGGGFHQFTLALND